MPVLRRNDAPQRTRLRLIRATLASTNSGLCANQWHERVGTTVSIADAGSGTEPYVIDRKAYSGRDNSTARETGSTGPGWLVRRGTELSDCDGYVEPRTKLS